MPDYRILKGAECPSCKGKIGYFVEKDILKCLNCGETYSPDTPSKKAKADQDYFHSEKGKKAIRRYLDSDKGKKAQADWRKTTKGKLAHRRYYYSDKGQDAHARHQEKVKRFKDLLIRLREKYPDLDLDTISSEKLQELIKGLENEEPQV